MTRINTNVSSLIAQKDLARSNADLQSALTRLSTGLRINVGKDDPAGLIASEALRSDIISVEKAITNSERANQLIATADSALGQVSQLLNDIRGLVSEAANTGALSEDQIAANQLQLDSSLEAIDRIAQITSFQGRRLLDGNLDFITADVSSDIEGLQIDQANFGTQTEIGVQVNVVTQATRGSLNYQFGAIAADAVLEVGGSNGTEAFNFAAGSTIEEIAAAVNLVSDATGVQANVENDAAAGVITVSSFGAQNDIIITADQAGLDEGDINVKYSLGGSGATTVDFTAASGGDPGTIDVNLQVSAAAGASGTQLDDDNLTKTTAVYTLNFGDHPDASFNPTPTFATITAATAGAAEHGVTVQFVNDESVTALTANASASYDAENKVITVSIVSGVSTGANAVTAINALSEFGATGSNAGLLSISGNGLVQTTDGVGDDNNALDVTAKISGTDFNNTDIHIVAGKTSEAGTINTFVNKTSTFYGEKTAGGNENNDFTIGIASGQDIYQGANAPAITVQYEDTTGTVNGVDSVVFNTGTNELTITADFTSGNVTANEIVTAVNASTSSFTVNSVSYDVGDIFTAANVSGDLTGSDNVGDDTAFSTPQDNRTLGATGTVGQVTQTISTFTVAAVAGSKYDGLNGNKLSVAVTDTGSTTDDILVSFDEETGVLSLEYDAAHANATQTKVAAAINGAFTTDGNRLDEFLVASTSSGAAATADISGLLDAGTAGTGDINNTAGAGYEEVKAEYHNNSTAAQAAINGLTLESGSTDAALILTAATAGTTFNNVAIDLVSGAAAGAATASFAGSTLTIQVDIATNGGNNTSFNTIIAAIAAEGTFTAALDTSVDTTNDGTATINGVSADVGNTGNTGAEAGALFLYIEDGVTTAQNAISALAASGNERTNELFTIANSQDSDGSGLLFANTHTDQLTGGTTSGTVVATGQEVIDAINADAATAAVVTAALAANNSGITAVTEFQEFAFSGVASSNTRLQLLGPDDATDIRFVSTAGTALSADLTTDPKVLSRSEGTLSAQAGDASLTFRAVDTGTDFDDVVVRFDATQAGVANTVTFDTQDSQSQAVIQFTGDSGSLADLKLTAVGRTSDTDGVTVTLADTLAGGAANASYDSTTKVLTVNYDGGSTTASTVIAAIASEGTFTAAVDYADNDAATGAYTLLAGDATTNATTTATAGGGHKGGVLQINIDDTTTTAQNVIDLLAGDDYVSTKFNALAFGPLATGLTDVRNDTNKAVTSGGVASAGTLIVNLETDANGLIQTTAADLISFFDAPANAAQLSGFGVSLSNAEGSDGSGVLSATTSDISFSTSGTNLTNAKASAEITAVKGIDARYSITAVNAGSDYDGVSIVYDGSLVTAGSETASYNANTKTLTIAVKSGVGASSATQVVAAITSDVPTLFTASLSGTGAGLIDLNDTGTTSGGVIDSGTEDGAALLGNKDLEDGGLTFQATRFGSNSFVQVKALSGTFALTDVATSTTATRVNGTDVDLRINGIQAIGNGLKASINTSSLDLSFSLDDTVTDNTSLNFQITGGGALFQLGPDVVSNQQARLGVQSVSTATLGGVSGRLFELRSGGNKALNTDVGAAAAVIDEVIGQVTQLRGRLGAFQKTTLESNIFALNDTLANLTDAESSIRDADFAAESAKLTRAQILVQSGTSVLGIANSNPQNVLALLR